MRVETFSLRVSCSPHWVLCAPVANSKRIEGQIKDFEEKAEKKKSEVRVWCVH